MPLTSAQLLADQAKVFTDFPGEELIIDGQTYTALVVDNTEGLGWDMGGNTPVKTIRVAVERSTMPTLPTQGDLAQFRGVDHRVGQIERDDAAASVHLTLEHDVT